MSLIPFVVPPLHGLRVLVTRPAEQAAALGAMIAANGGEARVFPSIAIEPVTPAPTLAAMTYDWIVFVSAHAVRHGAALVPTGSARQVVAIGRATATALEAASWSVDFIPPPPHTSEALLSAPEFLVAAEQRVLIVRGMDGRDLLDRTLRERGAAIDSLVVYRRVPAAHSPAAVEELEREWEEDGIGIVTATSVDTLTHLHEQLGPVGRALLQRSPLLVVSERIAQGARALGLTGECVLAPSADPARLVGTLAHWFARSR